MDLVGRQLQWVFGTNPFGQSLMYGEGYDFAPQFAYCLKDVVGSLPVGMDSMSGDMPYWSGSTEATFKEIWVEPVSRFLGTSSVYAMEARQTAQSDVKIEPVVADANQSSRRLKVNIAVKGHGRHTIGVRAFNAETLLREQVVELAANKPVNLEWQFQIHDAQKPWVIVFAADGDWQRHREIVGAFVSPDGLD
jgi:hypothetical protein